ncbi:ATP-grasp domain-containing protein [Sinomonas humi]|uniref:ATP-grasp domain-containing protein n=1 Tax=Sinomonas humi TaxID=1338436 RepID=UPI00068FB791|nr:hypothetical protein [Sinomonas humi]
MNLNSEWPTLLLASWRGRPDGENGGGKLVEALQAQCIDARWVVWDDPSVDWAQADAVAIRSAWDYHERLPEFLRWARGIAGVTHLLNGADAVAWSSDKAYLLDLARVGVPIVPTMQPERVSAGLAESFARWGSVVVKPRVGAGGSGVTVLDAPPSLNATRAGCHESGCRTYDDGTWLAQPHVPSVHTLGESSVFVFGGVPVTQVDKTARRRAVALDADRAGVAAAAVQAAAWSIGRLPDYARVDLLNWQGRWCVSELELIEPSLYLDVEPSNAQHFAALVRECLL